MVDPKSRFYVDEMARGVPESILRGGSEEEAKPLDPWAHRREGMRCSSCLWYVVKSRDGKIGRCRRRSPTMQGYPVVFETDWCGDHKLDEDRGDV